MRSSVLFLKVADDCRNSTLENFLSFVFPLVRTVKSIWKCSSQQAAGVSLVSVPSQNLKVTDTKTDNNHMEHQK